MRTRRLAVATALCAFLGALLLAYGYWIEPNWIEVTDVEIPLPGLPAELERLRVVLVSDLHVDDVGVRERRLVRRLKELRPDLLLFAGDFITSPWWASKVVDNAAAACSLLATVPTTYGIYGVWGNNDNPDLMQEVVDAARITILDNRWVRLHLDEGDITILGLGDPVTGRDRWDEALAKPPPAPILALAHSPDAFQDAAARGLPVLLVGHTHGGQIRTPLLDLAPSRFLRLHEGTPAYRAGLYHLNGSTMYVSRGIGTSHVPFRFLVRPEITRLHLRRED